MELKFVERNAKRIEIISLAFASFRTIERIGFLWRQSLESLLSTFIPPRIVLSRLLYTLSRHRTSQSISVLEFTVFHAAIQERRSLLWSPFWIQRSGSIECPSRKWKYSQITLKTFRTMQFKWRLPCITSVWFKSCGRPDVYSRNVGCTQGF